jgi:Raf kinase inhibitor-like YbhB/YbcL family protein
MSLTLTSTAFVDGGEIPTHHTCEGENGSPDLAWSGVPEPCQSLVLLIDDPDAPDPQAPRMVWDHWVLYNLPPEYPGLAAGISAEQLPPGTGQGLNSWGHTGYSGPCPAKGRHRYFHILYALDTRLPDLGTPNKNQLLALMEGHILARTELVGVYPRQG